MSGRILITGDKHGTFLPFFSLAEKIKLQKNDILLIAGDAGYVWNENFSYGIETLQQIFPGTITFIDGNHENHALLNSLEICQWNGGKAHRVGERVYHLMRGEIYSIYGNNFFTFGGARSIDKDRREEGISWWKEEEPTPEEIDYGRKQLVENYDEIDYVITHETPLFAREYISRFKQIDGDYHLPAHLEDWYNLIKGSSKFKKWYFGHMHVDQVITPQLRGVHTEIIPTDEEKSIY